MKYIKANMIHNVYITNTGEIIVTGEPMDENKQTYHNCDEMGCSSLEHILLKADVSDVLCTCLEKEGKLWT